MQQHPYGHFNEDGSEFIVTNPNTPHAFDNFLWNDSMQCNVWQTGVGYCDYQINGTEGVQLFSGIGRTCDIESFGRGHLMSRIVYVRDNDTGEFWNVGWEPVCKPYEAYECVHGLGYTTISSQNSGIASSHRIFVPQGSDPVELWTFRTRNASSKKRNLSIFFYNQVEFRYKWGFDSYGTAIYRSVVWNKQLNAVVATKHPYLRPHNWLTAFFAADAPIDAFDGSQEKFCGMYNTLQSPVAVERGRCGNNEGTFESTIAAMQFDFTLEEGAEKEINIVIGITDNAQDHGKISVLRDKYMGKFDGYLAEVKKASSAMVAANRMVTPDEHLNKLLNNWVKQATRFGADWCRWGFMGYRDIVQHGYGVVTFMPARTRKIILEALQHQYQNGLAVRGWNPLDTKPYSDSALWLVFTLTAYLRETGDMALLDEVVSFYDGGTGTVRQHIDRALDFLEANKGVHELILIKFGDWNDSLTSVGKEGRGESVWLCIAYAEAMRQMAALAEFQKDTTKQQNYLDRRNRIIEAINKNAWDGGWYKRCYDDNGAPVGSKENDQAQIFMEPQCWALIAGVADKNRIETIIQSLDEKLMTEAGYLLLAPTYHHIEERVGRISSMEPGNAENGTIYSHLNIWMILGLLRNGMADKAYSLFKRISPGYYHGESDSKQQVVTFQYANSYFGPDHKHSKYQMEFTWITGSVAWFNNVILREMVGAEADYNGIRIQPCLPSAWDTVSVERHYRGDVYNITVKNPSRIEHGAVEVVVDGNPIEGDLVPVFGDGKVHSVVVTMKRQKLV
jgi:cellobiose phosphorylase